MLLVSNVITELSYVHIHTVYIYIQYSVFFWKEDTCIFTT